MQEEIRLNTRDGSSSVHDDEEDCALVAKAKKKKGKKFHSRSEAGEDGKEHNMSKLLCYKFSTWYKSMYTLGARV